MQLTFQKLSGEHMTREQLYQFARIQRGGRRFFPEAETLREKLRLYEVFACFDGERMAAAALAAENIPGLRGIPCIVEVRPDWEYNSEEVLTFLIREIIRYFGEGSRGTAVALETEGDMDPNYDLFRTLGFAPLLQQTARNPERILMIARITRKRKREICMC